MDARELVKRLSRHPVATSDMTMQVQLGLPYLERRNGKLCVSFKPHVEMVNGENIEFYRHQYEIAWVYPFNHMISFENLAYSQNIDLAAPVSEMPLSHYSKHGVFVVEELYKKCTRVLAFQEKDGEVSDLSLRKYQQAYYEVVRDLGLDAVYGAECV